MAKAGSQSRNDEFTRIFDEYYAKIEAITRSNGENRQTPRPVISDDDEGKHAPANEIIIQTQPAADDTDDELMTRAREEASEIIETAKLKAQQIIREAEDKIRKEAKNKTKSEVDKIIARTRKESEDILARTKQLAEKERGEIVARSKEDVEQLIRNITENCRKETQEQSAQIVTEAQEKAEKMIAELVACSEEASNSVLGIIDRTKSLVADLESSFHAQHADLDKTLASVRERFARFRTESAEAATAEAPAPPELVIPPDDRTVLSVQVEGNGRGGNDGLFCSQIEFKTVSSFDYPQIKKFRDHFTKFPGIRYLSESVSEKEMSVLFDMKEPLPLFDILSDIPLVDEVLRNANGASVVLKSQA